MADNTGLSSVLQKWLIVGFAVALVAMPILGGFFQGGFASWHLAQSRLKYRQGERAEALAEVESLAERHPEHLDVLLTRAEWLAAADRDMQALDQIEALAEKYPDNLLVQRSRLRVYQETKRFAKAAELYEQFELFAGMDSATRLNGIAYFRALAGSAVNQGKREIDSSLEEVEDSFQENLDTNAGLMEMVMASVAGLRGLSTEVPDGVEASRAANPRLVEPAQFDALYRATLDKLIARRMEQLWDNRISFPAAIVEPFVHGRSQDAAQREQIESLRRDRAQVCESLALLLALRALNHQLAGEREAALLDRQYIRGLGFDEQDLLDNLPSPALAAILLDQGGTFLDTAALVNFRVYQANGESASKSLANVQIDVAVVATDALALVINDPNQTRLGRADLERWNSVDRIRNEAVLHYHRLLIYERSNPELASAERKRVEALGFEANDDLN